MERSVKKFNVLFLILDIEIRFPCSTKKNGTGEVNVTMRFASSLNNVTLALNVMKICGEPSMSSFHIVNLKSNLSLLHQAPLLN